MTDEILKVGDEVYYIVPIEGDKQLNWYWGYTIYKGTIKAFIDWDTLVVGNSDRYNSITYVKFVAKTKTELLAKIKDGIRHQIKGLQWYAQKYKENFTECIQRDRQSRRLTDD